MEPSTPEPEGASQEHPLSSARPGAVVRIEVIGFEFIRSRCRALAIREGDRVRCVGRTSSEIVLLRSDGRRLSISDQWARFIQVRTVPGRDFPGGAAPVEGRRESGGGPSTPGAGRFAGNGGRSSPPPRRDPRG